jgi:hypothetical protein
MWALRYDRRLDDIFQVQDVAMNLIGAVPASLSFGTVGEFVKLAKSRPGQLKLGATLGRPRLFAPGALQALRGVRAVLQADPATWRECLGRRNKRSVVRASPVKAVCPRDERLNQLEQRVVPL